MDVKARVSGAGHIAHGRYPLPRPVARNVTTITEIAGGSTRMMLLERVGTACDGSAHGGIGVAIEEAVGALGLPDVADDFLYLVR